MEVDDDNRPPKTSNNPPTAPKQMRNTTTTSSATPKENTTVPPVAEREPNPQPAVKPYYKVCYGCQSQDHLIADCYRLKSSPRSSTFTIAKFLEC